VVSGAGGDDASQFDGLTPISISPRLRNALVIGALVALLLLLLAVPAILKVLLGGATLALVLSFPVRLLARVLPRGLAILLVLLALLLACALALVALVPVVIDQGTALVDAAPGLVADAERQLRAILEPLRARGYLQTSPDQVIDSIERGLAERAQALGARALAGIASTLAGAFGAFLQFFGILFVAIYLLADIRRFKALYLRLVPGPHRDDAAALWDALGRSLSRYLGGLVISLTVQGVLAWIGLTLIGVPYAALLGLWMAVSAVIPYLGAWLGAIPAVLLALFVSPLTALLTALLYVGINVVEGNLLTPRIQGQALDVHPLLVFFTAIAGGQLFGLAGVVFAVPLLAMLRVLFDFFAARLYVRPTAPPDTGRAVAAVPPATSATGDATRAPDAG
jgi:predicted PurR-regulated permease PerM